MGKNNVKLLIATERNKINYNKLISLILEYEDYIDKSKFPKFPDINKTIEVIEYFKRTKKSIGPYENITPLEAANRIATDMLVLYGIKQIVEGISNLKENAVISISLGTEQNQLGDFCINGQHGEAFNVAESFFRQKLYKTIKKWDKIVDKHKIELTYILFNAEVLECEDCNKYLQQIMEKYDEIEFIPVKTWHK